ncbi:uncharacterized protein LOC124914884 [Impatiens glandulifera]|uniref:uncharacterized protein LOC124914884 n=1 Tax=Impatiens glandulifera TaxID=253017 RepID=UPI001FB17E03|nr:uncharacterized protein LOC124914884 [Impatiens glandulifera]
MASMITQRSSSSMIIKAPTLGRLSFNFFRNLSSSAPVDSSASLEEVATKKPKRKRPKNLIEVVQFLPNWGIGYHMAKKHWKNVSYEITKINLYKDGRHGKAWGLAYKDGKYHVYIF